MSLSFKRGERSKFWGECIKFALTEEASSFEEASLSRIKVSAPFFFNKLAVSSPVMLAPIIRALDL